MVSIFACHGEPAKEAGPVDRTPGVRSAWCRLAAWCGILTPALHKNCLQARARAPRPPCFACGEAGIDGTHTPPSRAARQFLCKAIDTIRDRALVARPAAALGLPAAALERAAGPQLRRGGGPERSPGEG